jgi:hypothetical protein
MRRVPKGKEKKMIEKSMNLLELPVFLICNSFFILAVVTLEDSFSTKITEVTKNKMTFIF